MTAKVEVDEILTDFLLLAKDHGLGPTVDSEGYDKAKLSLLKLIEEALPKPQAHERFDSTQILGQVQGHNSCLSQVRDGIRELFK